MGKRVLMVATVASTIGQFNMDNIRILQENGYVVDVACNFMSSRTWPENKIKSFKKKLMEMGVESIQIDFSRHPFNFIDHIQAYRQFISLIKKRQYNFIHTHTPIASVLVRIAAKIIGTKVIYTAHGFHFYEGAPFKNWIVFYPIEKFFSRYTDVLITINNEDYNIALEKFYAKKIERIHGVGIDIDKFIIKSNSRKQKRDELGISNNKKMLLSIGELDRDKNHIEILEAMRELKNEDFVLVIAGNGSLMNYYTKYIKSNELEKYVYLLGYRTDVFELLQAADIYVFPSLFEGLSVALMEAVAVKIPIACSKVRGNIDTVITQESYFSPNSPSSLVAAIKRISSMSDYEKVIMVEKNYENLMNYKLSEVHKEMKEIYANITLEK